MDDYAAVADLVHLYARAVRRGDGAGAAALFLPDGIFVIEDGDPALTRSSPRARLEGVEAIREYVSGAASSGSGPIPMIHNLMITIDGDTAMANSLMEALMPTSGKRLLGEYHDTARRVDGRWLFAERRYTIFG